MLGHASAAMTLDAYSDLFDEDLDVLNDVRQANAAKPLLKRKNGSRSMTADPNVFQESRADGT